MHTLKIALLGSALLLSGAAFAGAPEGNGNVTTASYAAPQGNGSVSTASYTAPQGDAQVSTAGSDSFFRPTFA